MYIKIREDGRLLIREQGGILRRLKFWWTYRNVEKTYVVIGQYPDDPPHIWYCIELENLQDKSARALAMELLEEAS